MQPAGMCFLSLKSETSTVIVKLMITKQNPVKQFRIAEFNRFFAPIHFLRCCNKLVSKITLAKISDID